MKRRLIFGTLLLILLVRWLACDVDVDKGPVPHLTDRMWVNKVPAHERDMVLFFALTTRGERNKKLGLVMHASAFRFLGDLVFHRLDGHRLTLAVPQDNSKVTFRARTWKCDDAPEPFDLCLELRRKNRAIILYSELDQTIDADEALAAPGLAGRSVDASDADCADCVERAPAWFDGSSYAVEP